MFGSFLNVVIHRLPLMMEREWRHDCEQFLELSSSDSKQERYNLFVPGSACPSCGKPIGPANNIPVISYLVQRGRCTGCGTRISIRYPIIEILAAVTAVVVAQRSGVTLASLGAIALTWALIALSAIDFDKQLLPDALTYPFLWLGLLLNISGTFVPLAEAVIGAAAGYLSLWSIYWLFKLATGKEGMAPGDFKLLAVLGAWLGWQALPLVILLSSLVGAAVGLSLIAFGGHDRGKPIPFGPYLAAAGWIALLWGDAIMSAYLGGTG
ncbi:MAG: A24 family peptidase, partial [Gammaproteobacteria bacterium]|nr:A24 family peptidase [Gammaproteobacteria bacterium]